MKRITLLLVVALVSFAVAWGQGNVRVMTLGLKSLPAAANPVARDYQNDALRSVLLVEHPDIVGLQDLNPRMAAFVRSRLTSYAMVGDSMCILYSSRAFSLVEWGSDSASQPSCTWAVLRHKASGGQLLVLSSRLDTSSAEAQRDGLQAMALRIETLRQCFEQPGETLPTFLTLDCGEPDNAPSLLTSPHLTPMGFTGLSPLLHDASTSVPTTGEKAPTAAERRAAANTGRAAANTGRPATTEIAPAPRPHRRPQLPRRDFAAASEGVAAGRILFCDASPVDYSLSRRDYGAISASGRYPALFTARLWPRQHPQRILVVGSQLTADIADGYVADIAREAGRSVTIGHLSLADASLEDHARSARLMERRYEYRKYRDGRAVTSRKASTLIGGLTDDAWDMVVLQQSPPRSGRPASYEPFLTALLDSVRHHCPAAALALQQPWAYAPDAKQAGFELYGRSQRAMYERIVEATCEVTARHYFDYLIPTGAAIQMARVRYSDIFVRRSDSFTRDGERLTERAGRFLAALVWAESVLGIDVRTTTFAPHGIKPAYAELLRECAHDAAH